MTRLYFQVPPDEPIESWSDEAIWDEMLTRMTTRDGWKPNVGRIIQKGVTPMRSFVAAPMRYGRLFLAGDSAHIVPPTGAKGLNLAASDVLVLARAMKAFYERGRTEWLDEYSDVCLRRVWKAQRFSWWMTSTLHRSPDGNAFDHQRQIADLDYLTSSRAAMTSLARRCGCRRKSRSNQQITFCLKADVRRIRFAASGFRALTLTSASPAVTGRRQPRRIPDLAASAASPVDIVPVDLLVVET